MGRSLKNIYYFAGLVVSLLVGVAAFNIYLDPMCYYRCETIDTHRATQNVYYQSAQIVAANPDAEVLIVGSSRGQTIPPQWVEDASGLKTVNISVGGADVLLKTALIRIALEQKLPLKKVIWVTDYFEVAGEITDTKVRQTPVLSRHIRTELGDSIALHDRLEGLQRLIDHNTFEASLRHMKPAAGDAYLFKGSGSEFDYKICQKPDFKGYTSPEMMAKEVEISYSSFGPTLRVDLNPKFMKIFTDQVQFLSQKGIDVVVLIPPFHPDLIGRFNKSFPGAAKIHSQWIQRVQEFESDNVHVLSFWEGIPGDDSGPSFWNDGAHPTCRSMIMMLEKEMGALGSTKR